MEKEEMPKRNTTTNNVVRISYAFFSQPFALSHFANRTYFCRSVLVTGVHELRVAFHLTFTNKYINMYDRARCIITRTTVAARPIKYISILFHWKALAAVATAAAAAAASVCCVCVSLACHTTTEYIILAD